MRRGNVRAALLPIGGLKAAVTGGCRCLLSTFCSSPFYVARQRPSPGAARRYRTREEPGSISRACTRSRRSMINGSDSSTPCRAQERSRVSYRGRGLAKARGTGGSSKSSGSTRRAKRRPMAVGRDGSRSRRSARTTGSMSGRSRATPCARCCGGPGVLRERHEARVAPSGARARSRCTTRRAGAPRAASNMTVPAHLIVGRVRRAHGIRGEVVVEVVDRATRRCSSPSGGACSAGTTARRRAPR